MHNNIQSLFQISNKSLHKKISIKDFFSKCDQIRTEEILNGKLHFLCSESYQMNHCIFSVDSNDFFNI